MRNIVVHVYFTVNAKAVWDTITNDMPLLRGPLKAVLNHEQPLVDSDRPEN